MPPPMTIAFKFKLPHLKDPWVPPFHDRRKLLVGIQRLVAALLFFAVLLLQGFDHRRVGQGGGVAQRAALGNVT